MGYILHWFCFYTVLRTAVTSHEPRSHHKKKYVIEVQDHQQAMRYANPIIDLEDTVRRGINDPLADPRFIMNKIGGDTVGLQPPLQDNNFHNNEFLSYHGNLPSISSLTTNVEQSSSILGVGTDSHHLLKGLTPNPELNQKAVKEEVVAKHPPSIPMLSDMVPFPNSPFHPPLKVLAEKKNPTMLPLSDLMSSELSANIAQNVANGLTQGLPGGAAAFASGKITHLDAKELNEQKPLDKTSLMIKELLQKQMMQKELMQRELIQKELLQKQLESKQQQEKELLARQLQQEKLLEQAKRLQSQEKQSAQRQLLEKQLLQKQLLQKQLLQKQLLQKQLLQKQQLLQQQQQQKLKPMNEKTLIELEKLQHQQLLGRRDQNKQQHLDNINPLTGLPEDLEDRTYGSVSSVTSLTDPQPIPSTITVNAGGDTAYNSLSHHAHESVKETPSISPPIPSQKETSHHDNPVTPLEETFPSLKSFLEADNILREKLNKDTTVDPTAGANLSEKTMNGDINLGPDFDVSVGDEASKSQNPSKRSINLSEKESTLFGVKSNKSIKRSLLHAKYSEFKRRLL